MLLEPVHLVYLYTWPTRAFLRTFFKGLSSIYKFFVFLLTLCKLSIYSMCSEIKVYHCQFTFVFSLAILFIKILYGSGPDFFILSSKQTNIQLHMFNLV